MPTIEDDYRDNFDLKSYFDAFRLAGSLVGKLPNDVAPRWRLSVGSTIARAATECATCDSSAAHPLIALYYCNKDSRHFGGPYERVTA